MIMLKEKQYPSMSDHLLEYYPAHCYVPNIMKIHPVVFPGI